MVKRVYIESVKKWAKGLGISGVSLFGLIFMYLIAVGSISSVSYSGDVVCAGTIEDPCYAYINFTAEEDIFIYPTGYDPWGRDTLFNFNPGVKSWRLERSWGTGWRNIPINTTCTGTWCGAKDNTGCAYSMAFRKDRDYQIRIVAYKNSPTDTLKWGAFSGVDEIDPFWYGINDTATTIVSNNISVELGVAYNFTTNLTGAATTCVDIDHPDYGDNYTCGSPNAEFTFNISYFRKTEFNDSSTVQTMDPPFFMNHTCWTDACSGSIGTSSAFETCSNITINDSGTIRMDIDLRPEWAYGESDPIVRIRAKNTTLLESHNVTLDASFTNGEYSIYFDDFYPAGEYGFCLRHEVAGEAIGFYKGDYIIGNPTYLVWPTYGIDMTTGEIIDSRFKANSGHEVHLYLTSEKAYIKSHQYDKVQNLSLNLTGINTAKNVKIYVNGTLSNTLGFIYNTSSGNISETDETSLNLLSGNSTTFSIPKGATVTNTTLNFTGSNATWETSEYSIPETWSASYGSPTPALSSGSQGWLGPASDGVDGNSWSGTGGWVDGGTLWDVEWMAYIYENYTKDTSAMTGNWSIAYLCSNNADITFDADCWSGSAWVEIVSDSGSTCYNGGDRSYRAHELPATCIAQSILQVKNSLQYGDVGYGTVQRAIYFEGKANYYRTSSPKNLTIEVGIVDGAYEYQGSGELTGSDSTTDFVDEVNSYLDTCAADDDDYCDVPIYFTSDDGGILTIDNFEVLYTYDPNPITISSSIVQNFLNSSTNDVDIPVHFSIGEGSFNVSDLRYDYKGGNDTISILAFEQGNTSNNETLNVFAYFSSFFKNLPYTWASKLFFMPKTNSSKNVTAYGQTTTIPAYNLTTTNYGGDINLSIKVDESFSCLNLSWSNNATKNESNVINTTWQTINSNVEYLNNTQIWFWADFENCNASDQRILQPSLEIEGYCINCEWI